MGLGLGDPLLSQDSLGTRESAQLSRGTSPSFAACMSEKVTCEEAGAIPKFTLLSHHHEHHRWLP